MWQAVQSMYGSFDITNANNANMVINGIRSSIIGIDIDRSLPTSALTQALSQGTDPKLPNASTASFQSRAWKKYD